MLQITYTNPRGKISRIDLDETMIPQEALTGAVNGFFKSVGCELTEVKDTSTKSSKPSYRKDKKRVDLKRIDVVDE